MKSSMLLAGVFVGGALQATAACAGSSDDPSPPPKPDVDAATLGGATADAVAADASTDSSPDRSMCSPAGWCPTTLPNPDFLVQDIWPFEDRAFAVANSPTLGVKVMEWTAAAKSWSYIDDDTQNAVGFGSYIGSLWAPNENELYYTIAPGYVYHGTRGPGAQWTWTRHQLPDGGPNPASAGGNPPLYFPGNPLGVNYPSLGVFGTSVHDIYAWFTNTIFHWKDDGSGTPTWVAEYSIEAPTNASVGTFILSAGASPSGEMWFAGTRSYQALGGCAIVIQKSASGYSRIADGTVVTGTNPADCATKPGYLARFGLMTDIQSTPSGRIFGLDWTGGVVELLPGATDQDWSFRASKPAFAGTSNTYLSMWAPSDAEHWLSGEGIVVQGINVLNDGGAWEISSIAENGAPVRTPFYRIRGTSTSNIWAVGNGYALHKAATP